MQESTEEYIQEKIFQIGVKRRRSVFLIILLLVLLLFTYLMNQYLYSYRESYTLRPSEVFPEPIHIRGIPGVNLLLKVRFQLNERADIYLFDEETYQKYYNKADFPERYANDAIAYNLGVQKLEVKMEYPPGTLYVVVKMPSEEKMVHPSADATLDVEYRPMEPILYVMIFLNVVAIPLLFFRLFALGNKAKMLRMQLSLDLDSLSDEDRVRLGLPPKGRPRALTIKPAEPPPIPSEPLPPHPEVIASPTEMPPEEAELEESPVVRPSGGVEVLEKGKGKGRERGKGYVTPEDL